MKEQSTVDLSGKLIPSVLTLLYMRCVGPYPLFKKSIKMGRYKRIKLLTYVEFAH